MRYLVLADIHANLPALDAVLVAASEHGFDRAVVLGDLVGYGAQPNEVIGVVRSLPGVAVVRGNHDRVVAGLDDSEDFNPVARAGARWTRRELTEEHAVYLRELPRGPMAVSSWMQICHGAPHDEDTYVLDPLDALDALRAAKHPLCLFGHTHVPMAFKLAAEKLDWVEATPDGQLRIERDATYLVNVGSVGQPRDGDSRAAFGIADDERRVVWFFRVGYDIESAQRAIRTAGLPEILATRLARGQ